MPKFVEMDERIKFKDQTDEKIEGTVILINKFNVHPDKVQEFLNDWADNAIALKRQQGFVCAQLHKGVGKSSVFVNYAVWDSMDHYKQAVNKILFSSEPQSGLLKYDDKSLEISPHLFKKVGVAGICGAD
jgi:quinol monooxygenase YgiN